MQEATVLGEDRLLSLARRALHACPADAAEVAIQVDHTALTRFANSQIHQNVSADEVDVRVRAIAGQRVGTATSTRLDEEGLARVAEQAGVASRLAGERSDLAPLPGPAPLPNVDGFAPPTAECTPDHRATLVGEICSRVRARGLLAAGACATQARELAIVNSKGVAVYGRSTSADLHTAILASEDGRSGYAARAACDVGALDAAALAEEALERATKAGPPLDLAEDSYEVVLEPYAVADIVEMLAYLGFSARAFQEGTSFLTGKLGQAVASERISLWDDALDRRGLPFPFDYEGVTKQRVTFIERGVAGEVVHDSQTAARAGRSSTGHALPAPNTFGPLPLHLFLDVGDAGGVEQLVANVERGVLVTRFWYTRPVHPLRVVVTGMTRDGTFLVREGRVVGPLHNVRYTQSYLEALQDVRGVTRTATLLKGDMFGACVVPALHLGRWRFQAAAS